MILEVLKAQEQAVFRQQLFNTLTTYYEEVQSMSGACRRPKPKHFKRTRIVDEGAAGGCAPLDEPVAEAGGNAPANLATPPAKKAPKARSWSGGALEMMKSRYKNKHKSMYLVRTGTGMRHEKIVLLA